MIMLCHLASVIQKGRKLQWMFCSVHSKCWNEPFRRPAVWLEIDFLWPISTWRQSCIVPIGWGLMTSRSFQVGFAAVGNVQQPSEREQCVGTIELHMKRLLVALSRHQIVLP